MKKVLKWAGIFVAGLVGLIVIAVIAVYVITEIHLNQTYQIQPETVAVPTDEEAIAEGKRLAVSRGCGDCHGQDLSGTIFIDAGPIGRLVASNLTAGQGGVGGKYSDADFIRAIRHGVRPNGKPLLFMPAQEFYHLNDADLGKIIAYIKSLPPVDNQLPASTVGPLGRVLYLTGQMALLPAELIDHNAPRPTGVTPGETVEYGQYLAVGCSGCHGPGYSGGPIPGTPPEFPPAANITPDKTTGIGNWSKADFVKALREGKRPDGTDINPFMPWKNFSQMTDQEVGALWLYLQTVPPKAKGGR